MKKILGLVAVLALLASCKTQQPTVTEKKVTADTLQSPDIIARHYQVKRDFQTVFITASARYEDEKQTQNVSADIRIKKDEKILVSVKFLGITMAKALLTPTTVKYYAKTESEYFEGDYSMLEKWLGTDLDFTKVQNLFIGEAIDDLNKGTYTASVDNKQYLLQQLLNGTSKSYWFEAGQLLVKKQQISQEAKDRSIEVVYPNHTQHPQMILPTGLEIKARQPKGKATINIDYKSATFNENLTFPYSVPDGYERIFID